MPRNILLDVPHELRTERLLLRSPRRNDARAQHEAVLASMNELRPFMIWAQREPTLEETEANLIRSEASFLLREELNYLFFLEGTGEFVGRGGLHTLDWRVPKGEIGYWAHSRHTGRGLITEAAEALARLAFELGLRRVEIRCAANNTRSAAVARRLAFQLDGVLRHDSVAADDARVLRDTMIFSRTH